MKQQVERRRSYCPSMYCRSALIRFSCWRDRMDEWVSKLIVEVVEGRFCSVLTSPIWKHR